AGIERYATDPATGAPARLMGDVALGYTRGLAVTPDGSRLYAAHDNGIDAYTIGSDGSLSALGETPIGVLEGRGLALTPDAKTLYATAFSIGEPDDELLVLAIGADGKPTAPVTADTQPRDLVDLTITPDGRFLYAAASGIVDASGSGIRGYAIGPA